MNRLALLFVATFFAFPVFANEPALLNGNARVVFVGDSITGQGGGWQGTGYVFRIREALKATYPDSNPDLVPLGGSGMGIGAWLGTLKNEDKQRHDLDVKGFEIAASLSKPADALVIMLGMNDVLAPYVNETDASLDQWLANYREVISLLSARLKPKVIGIATISPQTEDPETPKNRVMARMNQRLTGLAAELKARLLPVNATYWDTLTQGRKIQADFTLAADRIHPQGTGHIALAMAMLTGLGETKASAFLQERHLAKALAGLKPGAAPTPPPPWFIATGLVLRGWQGMPSAADLAPNPIDLAIERGEPFWKSPARDGGQPLAWRTFQSTINLTDGADPGSVDFAGVTFGQNFESGYGARWIHSDAKRRLKLELKTSGVGSTIHLTAWMNGQRVYSDLITKEPRRQALREVELRQGWNTLVFKSSHLAWQWQQALNLTEQDGSAPQGLQYRAEAP